MTNHSSMYWQPLSNSERHARARGVASEQPSIDFVDMDTAELAVQDGSVPKKETTPMRELLLRWKAWIRNSSDHVLFLESPPSESPLEERPPSVTHGLAFRLLAHVLSDIATRTLSIVEAQPSGIWAESPPHVMQMPGVPARPLLSPKPIRIKKPAAAWIFSLGTISPMGTSVEDDAAHRNRGKMIERELSTAHHTMIDTNKNSHIAFMAALATMIKTLYNVLIHERGVWCSPRSARQEEGELAALVRKPMGREPAVVYNHQRHSECKSDPLFRRRILTQTARSKKGTSRSATRLRGPVSRATQLARPWGRRHPVVWLPRKTQPSAEVVRCALTDAEQEG